MRFYLVVIHKSVQCRLAYSQICKRLFECKQLLILWHLFHAFSLSCASMMYCLNSTSFTTFTSNASLIFSAHSLQIYHGNTLSHFRYAIPLTAISTLSAYCLWHTSQ